MACVKDGNVRVENVNYRLEVAQRLGLEEVPIVFVDSIENIDNIPYNNVKTLVKGEYNGNGNHRDIEVVSDHDAREWFIDGNGRNNSEQFNNGRTTTGNDRLYQRMVGYNNRPSSNTIRQQNSVQSQEKRLNDNISNQVNAFNLGRNNNLNTPINKNSDSNYNSFSKQVDEVVNGTWDKNKHLTVLEYTPQVLQ